jgi:hypothetical protein
MIHLRGLRQGIPGADGADGEDGAAGPTVGVYDFNIHNPNGVATVDTKVHIAVARADLTIKKIVVSTGNSSHEVAGDLRRADSFIGYANSVVINDFDTTSGVRSDDTITNPSIGAGKVLYLEFDSVPNADIKQLHFHIEWEYD